MCGIVGLFGNFPSLAGDIRNMTKTLSHRGPDAEGFFVDLKNEIALGHKRLSILDLSDKANQPFLSKCGRYVAVYNGEIYNHRQVATNMQLSLRTTCDTEVIVEAYAKMGEEFVHELNGMFAIAIWDKNTGILKLFRDRIGIKPLFYYCKDGKFAFASELKALFKILKRAELTIDYKAIVDLLHFGYIASDRTIYQEIKKLPNGNFLKVNPKKKRTVIMPFWKLDDCIQTNVYSNEEEAKNLFQSTLRESVKKRMIADVPLGTFLSGGIDSSTITALAQELSEKPVNTFSIGFKDSKYNESHFAKEVAKHLGTHHHELIITEKNALEQVDKLLKVYDEPFGDSSAIPTLLVSELARKHVKVALSGDGGDEQFLGYGMYQWAKRLSDPIKYKFRKPVAAGLKLLGNQRLKRGALVLEAPSKSNLKSHIFSQEQYFFTREEITKMLYRPVRYEGLKEVWRLSRELAPMEQQAYFDMNNYLKDDLLVKVDRASMFHSLEVRVPLLDHDVIAFTLNLDSKLKNKKGVTKYLLKQVLYDFAPSHLFDRPKWGFSVPMAKWLKQDLNYLIRKYLNKGSVEQVHIVRHSDVELLIKRFTKGENYLYNRLWILIQLHRFLLDHQ